MGGKPHWGIWTTWRALPKKTKGGIPYSGWVADISDDADGSIFEALSAVDPGKCVRYHVGHSLDNAFHKHSAASAAKNGLCTLHVRQIFDQDRVPTGCSEYLAMRRKK